MNAYHPRLAPPDPDAVEAQTWRVLLSLPGRVGMVDPDSSTEQLRLARSAFAGAGDPA
ncbi:MAG: hypothetical protein KF878_19975 [Planctomycetes bacterium]|nr:hypothetical protein [Planctomycetota bacterium]